MLMTKEERKLGARHEVWTLLVAFLELSIEGSIIEFTLNKILLYFWLTGSLQIQHLKYSEYMLTINKGNKVDTWIQEPN